MMMEVALSDKLRDVSFIYVIPIKTVGWPLLKVASRPKFLICIKRRPCNVDSLEFNRKKLTHLAVFAHIGNNKINIPKPAAITK
jgi:hypothetical protein